MSMMRKSLRFTRRFNKIRAMWVIARGGSVYFNMNQTSASWVSSTRGPFFSHGCTIDGRPIREGDVWT
jgi:hypothetical protein